MQKSYSPGIGLHSQENNGVLPKYLVGNHHPAIISREDFEKAQAEMLRRHIMGFKANNAIKDRITFLSGTIECGECGRHFVHSIKRNHKTGGLKEDDWVCTTTKKAHWKQKRCSLKRVHTNVIKREFVKLDGKIDLIITKSVPRFARNTVGSLTTIRKLKEKRIECFFEKENIWTFDGKGELLITIMSSLAQEEARSISENCTWGQRKRFADGKVSVAFGRFLGYDRGENGEFVVNREQAETVKKIYRMYLDGYGTTEIARQLTKENILSPGGKSVWNASSVLSILRNEKYKGDALLQKSYTSDFLTKKHLKNNGEVQQYYVTANHEPIVSPEVFEMVQAEIKLRKGGHGRLDDDLLFKGKLKCAVCGGTFSRFVWHSNTTHRKYVWHCTDRYMGKKAKCSSGNFSEEELKAIILAEINKIITPDYKGLLEITNREAFDTTGLEQKASALTDELTSLSCEIDRLSAMNARTEANLSEELLELEDRYNEKRTEYNNVFAEIDDKKTRAVIAEKFIKDLSEIREPLKEWDDEVFRKLVERVEIGGKGDVRVRWKVF